MYVCSIPTSQSFELLVLSSHACVHAHVFVCVHARACVHALVYMRACKLSETCAEMPGFEGGYFREYL